MPAVVGRERQRQLASELLDWIVAAAAADAQSPSDFMVNRLVQIDSDGASAARDLP